MSKKKSDPRVSIAANKIYDFLKGELPQHHEVYLSLEDFKKFFQIPYIGSIENFEKKFLCPMIRRINVENSYLHVNGIENKENSRIRTDWKEEEQPSREAFFEHSWKVSGFILNFHLIHAKPSKEELKAEALKEKKLEALRVTRAFAKIYEKLKKELPFHHEVSFDLETFKKQLQIDKMPAYKQYWQVKKQILFPTIKEIDKKTEIHIISFKEKKNHLKNIPKIYWVVTGFILVFRLKTLQEEASPEILSPPQGVKK